MSFTFAHPHWFWLLAIWGGLLWWRRSRGASLRYSALALASIAQGPIQPRSRWLLLLQSLGAALLVTALARPQTHEGRTSIRASGIDIVLAVDLSFSMAALDFAKPNNLVTRLDVTREVLSDFVDQRPNDRLGLVAFGEDAYLLSPLTLDHNWLRRNLDRTRLGLIPGGQTAIGPAIAMAANRLRRLEDAESRVVILLTDGENNVQGLPPIAAAEAAAAEGIRIYTIGVGREGEIQMPHLDRDGNFRYRRGRLLSRTVYNSFETAELERIAEITGGRFYRATDLEELQRIYQEIDRLERTEVELDAFTISEEWYALPATAGSACLALGFLLARTRWQRIP